METWPAAVAHKRISSLTLEESRSVHFSQIKPLSQFYPIIQTPNYIDTMKFDVLFVFILTSVTTADLCVTSLYPL